MSNENVRIMAVRWTLDEWAEVTERARKARLRPSTYVKARALGGRVRILVSEGCKLEDVDTAKATMKHVIGHE